jgi:hypothetical protein
MSLNLSIDQAIVYDVESFPNLFLVHMEHLFNEQTWTFEISDYRDDTVALIQTLNFISENKIITLGFNCINYDYPMLHHFWRNGGQTAQQMYTKNQSIFESQDRFGHIIWPRDRFAIQCDLFRLHHFDNRAKTTSLKGLEFNMRSRLVLESPIPFGTVLTAEQVPVVRFYCAYDTSETKRFAHYSMTAIEFRMGLIDQFGVDVLSWNDTKFGEELLVQRIGPDVCFDWSSGRKQKRQTVRHEIALADVIFPYVQFQHPEFNRVLSYLKTQVLKPDEFSDSDRIKTKGVFTGLSATVNGFQFDYGVGGIHGSVDAQRIVATDEWLIRDIDVASLYPSLAIVNRVAPEHLGEAFTAAYASLPAERKEWQAKKGKKCVEANSLKLASNGAYGKSNDAWSVLLDPKYTMTITVNGQLLLTMLAEWLMTVPTVRLVQINTDGITYVVHRDYLDQCKTIEKQWEKFTCLTLEDVHYQRMFIRDVNNYIAESMDRSLKLKGAYWYPDPERYHQSISEQQPPAWHKDLSCPIVQRAAVMHMVHGYDVETFIRSHTDPFDFMLRAKVGRADRLLWGEQEQQRITRYYISTNGQPLVKQSPPAGPIGAYKRRNGITDAEWHAVASTIGPDVWDERIHTKNKSRYDDRRTNLQSGHVVSICNDAMDFSFDNLNYQWYINESVKLIIK